MEKNLLVKKIINSKCKTDSHPGSIPSSKLKKSRKAKKMQKMNKS